MSNLAEKNHSDTNQPNGKQRKTWINVLLFVTTIFTVWSAGATGGGTVDFSEIVARGFVFVAALLGILVSHELGHYVMARRNRVDASLPYFLPFPLPFPEINWIGTLGAVIVMRGRIRSRNALMEVGAAGPLAGIIVAIPVLLLGLSWSEVHPMPEFGVLEGQSLLYIFLKWLAVGSIPEGHDVVLHPVAWAGWVGLFVTMLNLLPIGQLDGGHVVYALWGEKHGRIARIALWGLFGTGLIVMGLSTAQATAMNLTGEAFVSWSLGGMNWIVIGGFLLLLRRLKFFQITHPPTDDNSLSRNHRIAGYICLILFFVTFMPVPLRVIG